MEGIKKENFNLQDILSLSFSLEKDIVQICSPEKIDEEMLREFKNRARPIKLISLEKREWYTKIIHFDKEFLYVRVPSGQNYPVGTLLLVEFQTTKDKYIIQTFVHQVRNPMLCLQFQDPRKDRRYSAPSDAAVYYSRLENEAPWLHDNNAFIIRTTEMGSLSQSSEVSIKEAIGIRHEDESKDKKEVFSILDGNVNKLKTAVTHRKLDNISIGGCAFIAEEGEVSLKTILYVSLSLGLPKEVNYEFGDVTLSLFGIVRNIVPHEGSMRKIGVSFLKRISHEAINNFFMKWSGGA